ncbi:MAG: hypothetical protein ACJASQ_003058 [Crocinitomicaceae bacterium]|jgi:hypothetical protein
MKTTVLIFLLSISYFSLAQQELLLNENFTTENYAWTTTGDFSYNTTFSQYNFDIGYGYSSDDPHDIGTLEQVFTIPANTTSASLSFYANISSDEQPIQVYDYCTVGLETVGGGGTYQFIQLSNLDENNAYQNMNFSIPSSFFGSTVRLVFFFDNDGLTATRFRFDNVSVIANTISNPSNADFYVYNESINVSSVNAGNDVDVSCRQANQGTLPNEVDVYLGYYLSDDNMVSVNDYFFPITNEYSNLGDGDLYDNESANLTIPPNTTTGQYYILWKADYNSQFSESNELNNVAVLPLYVNGASIPPPTVNITSPNQYECVPTTNSILIEADITGVIIGKGIWYSIDGGQSWEFIWGLTTTNTGLSYNWPIPSFITDPTYVKFKVVVSYQGGNIEDTVDLPCLLVPPSTPFELDPNFGAVSHIFWPFETISHSYTWNENEGWFLSRTHGVDTHISKDYFALDYGKKISLNGIWDDLSNWDFSPNFICDRQVTAPFDFKLIKVWDVYSDDCGYVGDEPAGYGNQIIIQSDLDQDFAFRVAHLNWVNTSLNYNQVYPKGTILGEHGSTGNSDGPHAHCVLYKNIYENHSYQVSVNNTLTMNLYDALSLYPSSPGFVNAQQMKDKYAAEFVFDAHETSGSGGGGQVSIVEKLNLKDVVIFPNPSNINSVTISLANISKERLEDVLVYNSIGQKVNVKLIESDDKKLLTLNCEELNSGFYFVVLKSLSGIYRGKFELVD